MVVRGGGQVVSELAFYSNYPSLNPAEAYKIVSRKMRGYFFRKAKIKYFRGDIFLDVEICRR